MNLLYWTLLLYITFLNFNKKEVFFIPAEYRGKIVVVYGKPFGDQPKVDDSIIAYIIPKDGILISQSVVPAMNLRQNEFYLVDDGGRKSKLDILEKDSIFSSKGSAIYRRKIGIIAFGTIGSCSLDSAKYFCYSDFYIGSYSEIAKYYTPEMADDFQNRLMAKAKWLQK